MQDKPASSPNANVMVLAQFFFKVLPLPICALSIYLGYRLFVLGVTGQASLSIDAGKVSGQLLNAAPGIFFMLGGMVGTVATIYRGMDIRYERYDGANLAGRYNGLLRVKFRRTDRLPGGDHNYGGTSDAILDRWAGGPNVLDRANPGSRPTAAILNTGAILELHEDGPEVTLTAREMSTFIDNTAMLLNDWCSWTAPPGQYGERDVRATVATYTYEGKPTEAELRRIVEFYCELAGRSPGDR